MSALRRIYARQILARAGIRNNQALEEAFAAVPRENFLGPPPWELLPVYFDRKGVITDDPALLYQDVLVSLQGHRFVNNGCPALHAALLHAVAVRPGERVTHIGAGTGYYSAILSHLVGTTGQVTAIELDAELADRARISLAAFANVSVVRDYGSKWPQEEADVVYVNFGVGRPADAWIENLAKDGRLMFPLTAVTSAIMPKNNQRTGEIGNGPALLVTRHGVGFAAKSLGPVAFVHAESDLAVTNEENERLLTTLKKRTAGFIRCLKWRESIVAPERYWHIGRGWALGYDEP
ncbi:protein-L-isoaspartate O-methyltransferase [Methylocystis sp. B8]|uniref:protein-L-isoaspartate O-methyltransferase family protein n=1 Tax=Methylocystis sp. B8 TaxID=544938 RepID=UPI002484D4A9|nr:protein-L-isoaspartate O-methyltransferase [Methylocystis sp. B8]